MKLVALIALMALGSAAFGVIDLYFITGRGVDFYELGLLVAIFNVTAAVVELPFSVYFDRYSLRQPIVIGILVSIVSFVLYAVGYDFLTLAVAQALAGIAVAARSGSFDAYVLNQSSSKSFAGMSGLLGKLGFISGVASGLGGLLGIFLYAKADYLIWVFAALCYAAALIFFLLLPNDRVRSHLPSYADIGRELVRLAKFPITYVKVVNDVSAIGVFIFWQITFANFGLEYVLVGFLIISFTGSAIAGYIYRYGLPFYSVIWACLANALFVVILALSNSSFSSLLVFGLHVGAQVVMGVLIGGAFHAEVKDEARASSVSMVSLLGTGVGAGLASLAGWLAYSYGVSYAMMLSVVLSLVVAAGSLFVVVDRSPSEAG